MKSKILFDNTKPYGGFQIWYGDKLHASFDAWQEWWTSTWDDNLCEYKAQLLRKGKEFFLETESQSGKCWTEKLKTPFRIEL